MLDAWAGTSDGEFQNKEEEEELDALASDDENDGSDYGFDYSNIDDIQPSSRLPQTNFTVLSEKDIRHRQAEAIATITNFLSISPVDAGVLLRYFKWSISKVNDEWFADEERVRANVGLLEKPATSKRKIDKEMTCGICFEGHPFEKMTAPRCGHYFCETCWTGQVTYTLQLMTDQDV